MKGGTRKRGKTWSYYFDMGTVNGKRQKKEKGGFSTKKEAEAALSKALTEYNNAGMVFTPSTMTVSDFLDLWYDQYVTKKLKYNSQVNHRQRIKKFLKPKFGAYRLASLTTESIQAYAYELKEQGYARGTVGHIIHTLSGSMRYAVRNGYIKYNPCNDVEIPTYEQAEKETHYFLTPDSMKRIIERYPESSVWYLPIMIGYYTGVRISECFGLTWDHVDFEKQTITIDRQVITKRTERFFQSPKTRDSNRVIPYGAKLQRILKNAYTEKRMNRLKYGHNFTEYYIKPEKDERGDTIKMIVSYPRGTNPDLEPADFVCVRETGSILTNNSFGYVSNVINHELKIPFNYHSLRHTHATMLIQAGAPIKDVQARLGHADIKTTMNTYVHDTDAMKHETVDIFEKISILA